MTRSTRIGIRVGLVLGFVVFNASLAFAGCSAFVRAWEATQ